VGGRHGRLPDLALVALAVAQQDVGIAVPLVQAARQRHPDGEGQPLPQGAGGHLDAGDGVAVGVALQRGVYLAQGAELGIRQIAALR